MRPLPPATFPHEFPADHGLVLAHDDLKDFEPWALQEWGVCAVLTHKLPEMTKGLEKLNKKALKLGSEPIDLVVGETFKVNRVDRDGKVKPFEFIEKTYVLVRGPRPKFNGWALAATLQNLEGHVVVRSVPGTDPIPDLANRDPALCEHCQTDRKRTDTFVVRNDQGEVKQVGRQCLADFLGHEDPKAWANWAALMDAALGLVEDAGEDEFGGGGGGRRLIDLGGLLAHVAMFMRTDGWLPRSKGDPRGATVDWALNVMFPPLGVDREKLPVPEKKDFDVGAEAIQWALAMENPANDYLHNLKVYATIGACDYKGAGFAGSMIAAHARAVGKELEKAGAEKDLKPAAEREWVGTPGERVTLNLKLLYPPRNFEGDWGARWLHTFATDTGQSVTWWASKNATDDDYGRDLENAIKLGEWTEVKATVKKHDTYRPKNGGQPFKQTLVIRVKKDVPKVKKPRTKKAAAPQPETPVA
jgi:hypothetical protein